MYKRNYSMLKKRNYLLRTLFLLPVVLLGNTLYSQTMIKGSTIDAATQEILPGVTISIKNTTTGTVSDANGNFELNVSPGTYTIVTSYISYKPLEITDVLVKSGEQTVVNIPMIESEHALNDVVVVALGRINSEVSLMNTIRLTNAVASGVSAQQISKSQDRDASEVIKRIPGISVIDDKFVIARGLSQRYNNVWVNNSTVPSTESDTRSFSFDLIPSSQIENIMIIKSPQPELPADFSGGFIKVATKGIPNENSIGISYGMGINTQTHFHDFKYNKGSSTDFLGFDNGKRDLKSFVPSRLDASNADQITNVTKSGFNNDWSIHTKNPLPDQRFSIALNRKFVTESERIWGLVAALNYSNTSKTYMDMENSRYGVYDANADEPVYTNKYTDNQYNHDVRLGGLVNLMLMLNDRHKFEFRNMVNQLGKSRYTERDGYLYLSGYYVQKQVEYIYNSRLAYNSQLAGDHEFTDSDKLDWTLGFSYSNKNQPDRRRINWEENSFPGDLHNGEMMIDQGQITRDFIKLNENAYSAATNYTHSFTFDNGFKPSIKAGTYMEYKNRDYKNREFNYIWEHSENLPENFPYLDVVSQILIPENYGADKLYINETTNNTNNYSGTNSLYAGYLGINLPYNQFNVYAGVRLEHNKMSLKNYTTISGDKTKTTDYTNTDFFPSLNATYNLDKDNLLRIAYGRSINRPEFREVSSSAYYDFDLFSFIKGNPDLKPAYIQNLDLRYEFYPSKGEIISFAIFYKNFKNPIEWTYTDSGGSYTYNFKNAKSADNYGIELDIKKNFDFIGLRDLSFTFNGALIKSKLKFDKNSLEHDRAMQGQSPYLANAGLFYQNDKLGLTANALYNIIGKRIVGIGRVETSEGSSINNDIPDMYEMPRSTIDFSVSKKLGKIVELSAGIKDILAQKVVFKQFPKFEDTAGNLHEREQITKEFKPGRNITVTAKFNF